MTYFYHIPKWIQAFYPNRIWRLPADEQVPKIYLSFDDGPIPEVTPWVLEQLKAYQAKATFFCIGDNVRKHPQIFEQVRAAGHSIGNHTFNHLNGKNHSKEIYLENTLACEEYFKSGLFRPPYGRIKKAQAQSLSRAGYKIVMWDVLSGDWDQNQSPYDCLTAIKRYTKPGSIIVFHDSLKAWPRLQNVLPEVLAHYQNLGYQFAAI